MDRMGRHPVTDRRVADLRRQLVVGRIVSGLSMRDVARRTGVSSSIICNFEAGRTRRPSLDLILAYADALGATLSWTLQRIVPVTYPLPDGTWLTGVTGIARIVRARRLHGAPGYDINDGGTYNRFLPDWCAHPAIVGVTVCPEPPGHPCGLHHVTDRDRSLLPTGGTP